MSKHLGNLTRAFGSSPIAIPAYQVWPTKGLLHYERSSVRKNWETEELYARLEFENKSRIVETPDASNHSLYQT